MSMYRIRVGKKYFTDAHYVTGFIRWNNKELKSFNYSPLEFVEKTFWNANQEKTAIARLNEIKRLDPDSTCEVEPYDI
jgi:hypothetical protein